MTIRGRAGPQLTGAKAVTGSGALSPLRTVGSDEARLQDDRKAVRPACPRPPPQTTQEPRPSPADVRRSRPPDPPSTAPLPESASSAAAAVPHVPSLPLGRRELPVLDAARASEPARSALPTTASPAWGPEVRRPLSETSRHSRDAPGLDGTTIPGSLRAEVLPAGGPGVSGHGVAGVGGRAWRVAPQWTRGLRVNAPSRTLLPAAVALGASHRIGSGLSPALHHVEG